MTDRDKDWAIPMGDQVGGAVFDRPPDPGDPPLEDEAQDD